VRQQVDQRHRIEQHVKEYPSILVIDQPLVNARLHEQPGKPVKPVDEDGWLYLVEPEAMDPFIYGQYIKEDTEEKDHPMFEPIFQEYSFLVEY
jgi:hypothetical protein